MPTKKTSYKIRFNPAVAVDTLTRRIYRNAGVGAFGYGNDLPYTP